MAFTDDFTAADETTLVSHNANWVQDTGAIVIRSNTARGNTGGASYARWTGEVFNDDQVVSGVWAGTNSNGSISSAIGARFDSSQNGYYYWVTGSNSRLYRLNTGSATLLSSGGSVSTSDVIELTCEGTTLTCRLNGSTTGAPSAQTDSTHSGGDAALRLFNVGDSASIDSISGANLAGAATAVLTGSAIATINEDDITTGGETIIITLTDDTFKAAGTGPIGSTADTQALIDGFDAASTPANGWNNEVRDKALTSEIVRTNSTVATWTIAAQAGYDISSQEVITGTIPTDVLVTGAAAVVATPTFTIDPVSGISIPVIMNQLRNQGIS